jgi:hypothetical protein
VVPIAALVAVALIVASSAVAVTLPHRHEVNALYVIDHQGKNPVDPTELIAYSMPFQKILGGCSMGVTTLTNEMIQLANKASEVGARNVTALQMMQSVARRITWKAHRGCGTIMNLAEGHLEAGQG